MTAITLADVTAAYGDHVALRGLTLDVPAGLVTAVLGPSGCGKTTLIRVIAGFHRPSAGTVAVGGRVVDGPGVHVRPDKRRVGLVAQEVALFPNLDVAGNVSYGIRRWGRYDKRRAAELLSLVGLPQAGPDRVHQLSAEAKLRVAIARALAPDPVAIVMDEPFAGLDQAARESVRSAVGAALRTQGTTGVVVSHEPAQALAAADHIVLIRAGAVVQAGPVSQLYGAPASVWAARFTGDVVELPARGDDRLVSTALGELPVSARVRDPDVDGGPIACLRPEQLRADPHGVPGRVALVARVGNDAMVTVHVPRPGGGLLAIAWRTAGSAAPREGEDVRLAVVGGVRVYGDHPR